MVEEDRKEPVLTRVVSQQGPPDGTLIVSDATQEGRDLSDETVNEVVARLNEVGDIVIVRWVFVHLVQLSYKLLFVAFRYESYSSKCPCFSYFLYILENFSLYQKCLWT